MIILTIQQIFFKSWFWWLILLSLFVAVYLIRRKYPPPPPKPSKFFIKHKDIIKKITDICIFCFILIGFFIIIYFPFLHIYHAIIAPEAIRVTDIYLVGSIFLINMLIISSCWGVLIGLLSVFHSNLTKVKRIILLIISLLPIMFTTLLLLTNHIEKPEDIRLIIKLGLGSLAGCWIINGPAIITGKHFFRVSWSLLHKLRLVSGDYPE